MWPKSYRDYPVDKPLKKWQIESGKGIQGCEMHELNGWGAEYHHAKPKSSKKKLLTTWLDAIHSFFQRPSSKDEQS